MGKINKLSDLITGNYYYVCLVRDKALARRVKLLAVINESVDFPDAETTELYFEQKETTNLVFAYEIGIGKTKQEAENNYGKFKYEKHHRFVNHFDKDKLRVPVQ